MRNSILAASLLALAVASPAALAHKEGDIIVRAGAITVDPHESSSDINAGGADIPGSKATLDSNTQLGLNFAYMVTDHVGIELLAATPFSHSVGVKGVDPSLDGSLGNIKHLPPTLSTVYYALETDSAFQPYVGLGLNYTWFFDTELTSSAEGRGFSGLDLEDSWGLAYQVGADYMLTDNIMLNAQVRYIDIDTTGTTYLGGGTVKVDVDVDVDPFVYMVGLGYKF